MIFVTRSKVAAAEGALALIATLALARAPAAGAAVVHTPASVRQTARAHILYTTGIIDQVSEYSPRSGKMIGQISLLAPTGLATDAQGNLYVSCPQHVFVYPPGSTTPSLTLDVPYPGPIAISRSGEVAVTSSPFNFNPGVAFFKPGAREPFNAVSLVNFGVSSIAYDRSGNLYVSGGGAQNRTLGEIIGGGQGSAITLFAISPNPPQGAIVVDQDRNVLLDAQSGAITEFNLPNPNVASGMITLSGPSFTEDVVLDRSENTIYVSGLGSGSAPYVWGFPYPAGGSPTLAIPQGSHHLLGIAVTPEAKP